MDKLAGFLRSHFIEHVELRADAARAFRAMIAFAVPVAIFHRLNQPAAAVLVSTAAMNLSLPDLRGAYKVRLGILATMTLIAAGSAFLGVCSAAHLLGAVAAMGLVALLGGVWRHLSADYGPSMAVSSALLFLLGLSQPGGPATAWHLATLTALGGLFATFLHGCYWLFRPQHALRYAVAETWVAASDLIAAMRPATTPDQAARGKSVPQLEGELRAALDRTFIILGGAGKRQPAAFIECLEEMRREVVHLTMRVIAFNTSLEPVLDRPDFARCLPVVDSVFKALGDAARSIAISLVIHRRANLAASAVRLRRCEHLVIALNEQLAKLAGNNVVVAQARATLAQIVKTFPPISQALAKTGDHDRPRSFIAAGLPDLTNYTFGSFSSWMRPSLRADPVLIRHSVRMAVFTMLAVALYKGFDISRGYWVAFTIMVVLQPDYGSTRQRAISRIGGTVGGSVLASGLLWIHLPLAVLDILASITAFVFAYFLRQRYWLAIFFVTVNLALITEAAATIQGDFMMVRILANLLGGGLALVAARVFWPVWEGENFPKLLAAAVRTNRTFLLTLSGEFHQTSPQASNVLMARRRAENANRQVAASVERLLGEPAGVQENAERAAALATYCQRVTRALTVLTVQMSPPHEGPSPITDGLQSIATVLERMANTIENDWNNQARVNSLTSELETLELALNETRDRSAPGSKSPASTDSLAWVQISKTAAELRAMTLALKM